MTAPSPRRPRAVRALVALVVGAAVGTACRRATPGMRDAVAAARSDAGRATDRSADGAAPDAPAGVAYGPPNPWGDGAVPRSRATGPEADATRATLDAVRASVGFWRIERDARTRCPTLADLAATPAAAFDPATMSRDAWGSPVGVECQGGNVRVRSPGPDRAADTPDDLIVQ